MKDARPVVFLIHSFPTNSILFEGMVEFFSPQLKVITINLPGFHKDVPVLSKKDITFDSFAAYVSNKIEEFGYSDYWIAGTSFGYSVLTHMDLKDECRGVFAIEPFLDHHHIAIGFLERNLYKLVFRMVSWLSLEGRLFSSKYFTSHLALKGVREDYADIIREHVDPATYFKVADILIRTHQPLPPQKRPHALIYNPNDATIKGVTTEEYFKNAGINLLEIVTTLPHFPERLEADYYASHIPQSQVEEVVDFMELQKRKST